MKKKLIISIIFLFAFFLILTINVKSNGASLEKEEIDLYCVSKTLIEKFPELEIPNNLLTEYQIKVKDTDKAIKDMGIYTKSHDSDNIVLAESNYVEIDKENGIISPKLNKYYNYATGELAEETYNFGTETVYIRVDNQELQLKVNIINYANTYVENKLKEYININFSGMSDYEKALAITKYVAENYDYSKDYQSYIDMYLNKCGDCWASTNLINKMCSLSGLKSHTRNGNQDLGAGSGHENNAIQINDKVYIADAGYSGNKPRIYDFYLEDPAFTSKINKDGTLTLLQYDGFESDTLIVPSTIKGKTVTTIGSYFYNSNTIRPKKIVLPNTITTIENLAFYPGVSYGDNLESINIPKSVTSIGYSAFLNCKKININLESNENFIIENNSIYNKDKTILLEVLNNYSGNSTYTIPNTVYKITKNAFYDVEGVKFVNLPNALEEISKEAFYGSNIEGIFIPKNVKKIESAAFASCKKMISVEFENESTCEIGDMAFASNFLITSAKIPSTITTIGNNVFYNNFGYLTIYGDENSAAQKYANENNINFSASKIEITDKFVNMSNEKLVYEANKEIKPQIEVKYIGRVLEYGKDYSITFDSDYNKPGKHQLVVKGIGNFSGEVTKEYTIEKAETLFNLLCEDVQEGENFNVVIDNPFNQQYFYFFENSNGYRVDNPGAAGEYKLYCQIYSNDYYKGKSFWKTVNIKPASIPLESIEREGYYTNWGYVGDEFKLGIKYNPSNTTIVKNVKWRSSNENVAKVDNDGNITAISEGSIWIYASIAGRSLSWNVIIKENEKPLQNISINSKQNAIFVGDSINLSLTLTPADATCKSDTLWSSSDTNILKADNNGKVTAIKKGTATITASKQDKKATYTINVKDKIPFADVKASDWFVDSVDYVFKNNIIKGYNTTKFAPNDQITRGMFVTILYRMEGEPAISGTPKFSDVKNSGDFYYKAVKWATDKGLVSGYSNGKFGPNDNITREQLAVILNKYAKYKNKNTSATNNLSSFSDRNKVSSWASSQMKWAVGAGVITGNQDGTLNPGGTATRAEAAAMLEKYCKKIGR